MQASPPAFQRSNGTWGLSGPRSIRLYSFWLSRKKTWENNTSLIHCIGRLIGYPWWTPPCGKLCSQGNLNSSSNFWFMKIKSESACGNLTINAERGGRNIGENVEGGRNIGENGEDSESLLVRSCPAGQKYSIQEQPVNKKNYERNLNVSWTIKIKNPRKPKSNCKNPGRPANLAVIYWNEYKPLLFILLKINYSWNPFSSSTNNFTKELTKRMSELMELVVGDALNWESYFWA